MGGPTLFLLFKAGLWQGNRQRVSPVSYTHLDVYKRQIMEYATLQNGLKMPMEGFGVFQVRDKEECKRCLLYTSMIV